MNATFDIGIPEWYQWTDPQKQIAEFEANNAGRRMESVIASGASDEDPKWLVSLFKQEGCSHDENMLENYHNTVDSLKELLDYYDRRNLSIHSDGSYMKLKKNKIYFCF